MNIDAYRWLPSNAGWLNVAREMAAILQAGDFQMQVRCRKRLRRLMLWEVTGLFIA